MQRMDLYQRAPGFLKTILCNVEGLKVHNLRYGPQFEMVLAQLVERGTWSQDQICAFRDSRVRAFVRTASSVPFYKSRFYEAGVDPAGIRTAGDICLLPVLTKQEARENIASLRNPDCLDAPYPIKTGGTTGAGLHLLSTVPAIREQWALWWRYRMWHGIGLNTWCGYFGARAVCAPAQTDPPFWRINYVQRQILFSGPHLHPKYLDAIIGELRRRQPPWLHGFPTLLTVVAAYIADRSLDLGYQVRNITIGAENLTDGQIAIIQKAFGVTPRQHYGMAEAVANFSECERGNMHIDEDYAAVELQPTAEDGVFQILGTNLANRLTPLLRYEVGDLVTVFEGSCGCPHPGRIVGRIHGRTGDYVRLRGGRMFGPANVLFSKMTNVRAGQIVHRADDTIAIHIVRAPGFNAHDEQQLRSEAARRLSPGSTLTIEYVEELRKTEGGKTPVVIRC